MNKIRKRAVSVLLLVALLIVGMGFYMFELFRDGSDWASFSANQGVYSEGSLAVGTITDRNGVVLSAPGEGGRVYNDDPVTAGPCSTPLETGGGISEQARCTFSPPNS